MRSRAFPRLSGGRQRRRALPWLLLSVLLTTGCWDRVEPDRAAAIIALGLDRGKEQPFRLTAQIAIPRLLAGGVGG
ncbi:MAG: hypothetical protein AB1503_05865, partial [Bacillota bacterium]